MRRMESMGSGMGKMTGRFVFSGIAVTDYRRASAWYETLFGAPPDAIVREGVECMWELREGAWIYIVVDRERAGKSIATIAVHDLQDALAGASASDAHRYSMETRPGVYHKAVFSDPDGNTVTLAKLLQAK